MLPGSGRQLGDGEGNESRHDVGEYGGHEQQGVDGREAVPAAPGGVGPHERKQVERHDHTQQHGGRAITLGPLVQGEEEEADHERRRERRRVAVEEHQVAPVLGVREDGVAGAG